MGGAFAELASNGRAAAMGAERAAETADGSERGTHPAGIDAACLDRAIAVLGERAALRVFDTELGYTATVGDDLADPTRSLTDVDHQVTDTETWHGSPLQG